MMMNIRNIALFLLVIIITGCGTIGTYFQYENVAKLEIGETKKSEYKILFGEPQGKSLVINENGKYEKMEYFFAVPNAKGVFFKRRTLCLEFKNGILNGYDYISSFEKEYTETDPNKLEGIRIFKTTKEEVLELLGATTGKALCPTTLYSIDDKHQETGEIWAWRIADPSVSVGPGKQIFIIFDQLGTVKYITNYIFNNKNK